MKAWQFALGLVAVGAGALMLFLMLSGGQPQPQEPQQVVVAQVPHDQVLVAKADIGLGERLSPENLAWQDWPQNTLQPGYITSSATPQAIQDMKNTVARFELFKGEPIQQAKLVHADQGYLSAVLEKGQRGVSISVAAESASGGFIVPNDHVDVILTHAGTGGEQVSETLLANVRVLAIGTRLGETGKTGGPDDANNNGDAPASPDGPKSQVFPGTAIATLELDPVQTETVINATQLGRLSLALRSIVDFNAPPDDTANLKRNAPIRLIRYGQEASVMTGQAAPGGGGSGVTDTSGSVNAANFRGPAISVGTNVTPE